MYDATLAIHNLLRWAVVLTGLAAVVRAAGGVSSSRQWSDQDDSTGRWFSLAMNAQFLVGLAMYLWVSPIVKTALADMGSAMKEATLRFWAVEHVTMMVLALGFVHMGRARVKKSAGSAKHKTALIFFGLALACIALGTPWPWSGQARPWIRIIMF